MEYTYQDLVHVITDANNTSYDGTVNLLPNTLVDLERKTSHYRSSWHAAGNIPDPVNRTGAQHLLH